MTHSSGTDEIRDCTLAFLGAVARGLSEESDESESEELSDELKTVSTGGGGEDEVGESKWNQSNLKSGRSFLKYSRETWGSLRGA